MATKNACPCDSGKTFKECCEPFLREKSLPKTAEQLMRSRYTAYTLADIPYIERTQAGKAAENFDAQEAKRWAEQAKWRGLNVIHKGKESGDVDEVEFVARYMMDNQLYILRERSQFKKINGKWFYTSGVIAK